MSKMFILVTSLLLKPTWLYIGDLFFPQEIGCCKVKMSPSKQEKQKAREGIWKSKIRNCFWGILPNLKQTLKCSPLDKKKVISIWPWRKGILSLVLNVFNLDCSRSKKEGSRKKVWERRLEDEKIMASLIKDWTLSKPRPCFIKLFINCKCPISMCPISITNLLTVNFKYHDHIFG